jgi:hypothetical protein
VEAKRFFKPKGILSKTRAQIAALKNAGKLIPGQDYLISDLDEPVLIFAVTTTSLANSATLLAKNPDYKNVGDYSGVQDVTGIAVGNKKGIWQPTRVEKTFILNSGAFYVGNEISSANWTATISRINGTSITLDSISGSTISTDNTFTNVLASSSGTVNTVNYVFAVNRGDIVLWDGFHWQKTTTATVLENPTDDNGVNYAKLLKTDSGMGYISDSCSVEYDTSDSNELNWRIISRRNNGLIIHNGPFGENNTNNCQWGNPDVNFISCDANSTINILNNSGSINNIDLRTGALFFASRNSGTINKVNISQGGNLDADLNAGSIHALEISKALVQAAMLKDFKVDNVKISGKTNIGLFNSENYVDNFYISDVGSNFSQNLEAVANPYSDTPPDILQVLVNENQKHYACNFYVSSAFTNASFDRLDVYNPNINMNYRYYPQPNLTLTFAIPNAIIGGSLTFSGVGSVTLNGANSDYIEFRNWEVIDPSSGLYVMTTKQVGGQIY